MEVCGQRVKAGSSVKRQEKNKEVRVSAKYKALDGPASKIL